MAVENLALIMEAFINVHQCSLAIKIGARTYLDRNTQSRMARLRHVRVSGNDGTRWQRHGLRGKGGMHAGRPLFSGRQPCAAAQHNTTQHVSHAQVPAFTSSAAVSACGQWQGKHQSWSSFF
jgi:hypothetical protein